jgi:hypothetical protein
MLLLLYTTLYYSHCDDDKMPCSSMHPMSDWFNLESDNGDDWVPGVWSLRFNQDTHDDSSAD